MSRMADSGGTTPTPHGEPPPAGGFDLDSVRSKPAYRAALWLIRLEFLAAIAVLYAIVTDQYGWLYIIPFAMMMASIAAAVLLLARAGYPVGRGGASRRASASGLDRKLLRDVFRLR